MSGRLLLIIFAVLLAAPVLVRADEVRVGVLAYRGGEAASLAWQPTVDYLNRAIPEHRFVLVPLALEAMGAAVAASEVEFVLTNAGHYVELEAGQRVSRIVTLESAGAVDAGAAVGSVVVVRADSDIRRLEDLSGRAVLAVAEDAFGGFQIAWREFANRGIDPFADFSSLRFLGFPQDAILFALEAGAADAGIIRTCLLERMVAEGRVAGDAFRILEAQHHSGSACRSSTPLYPDWPLAKLKHTPRALAKRVAQALLELPAQSGAAQAGEYLGWTIPVDYQAVHELMRELRIGPYRWLRERTLQALLERHWQWLVIVAFGIAWFLWHVARVEYLVRARTAALTTANARLTREIAERERAEEQARQQQAELAHATRLNMMGEMAAGLAHEINQPLAAIINYAQGCARRLESGNIRPPELLEATLRISEQAERAGTIIRRLREFLRKRESAPSLTDLNAAVGEAAALYAAEARKQGVAIGLDLERRALPVYGEMVEIEQVVLNLLRNAAEAMVEGGAASPQIAVTTRSAEGVAEVRVSDRGPGLDPEAARRLFEPFFTTKPHGMGLGLSISRSIVESHGGVLELQANPTGRGVSARFTLPLHERESGCA